MVEVLVLASVTAALAACGGSSGGSDGGLPFGRADGGRADGGTIRADGGGGGGDGGACNNDNGCFLAQKCVNRTCQADPGGTGTECPNGDECAQDALCTGDSLPSTGPICIRECQSNSNCPNPYTCQRVQGTTPDGGVQSFSVCLPADAFGPACRNQLNNGNTDPVRDCNTMGQYCAPDIDANDEPLATGHCVDGDNCNFKAQSGCASNETCHPLGGLGYDNNQATVCLGAVTTGGAQGDPCERLTECRKGYLCTPISDTAAVCLKYCTPGDATHNCSGITRPSADGGVAGPAECIDALAGPDGGAPPASISSIPVGLCF